MPKPAEVTAHRGDSFNFPENSIPAIESAADAGANWIEVDVRETLDNCLVLCHDPITTRLAERTLFVSRSTYEQLSRLDFAHGFRNSKSQGGRAVAPAKIAKLEEVLEIVRDRHTSRLSIHCKLRRPGNIVKLVQTLSAEDCVAYNDLFLSTLRRIREMEPSAHLIWDRWPWSVPQWDIPAALRFGVKDYIMHRIAVTAQRTRCLLSAGLLPGAWTINEEAPAAKLIAFGVKRFYTDDPHRLKRYLHDREDTVLIRG